MSGYREPASRTAFTWTCPFARRATTVGGLVAAAIVLLGASLGFRTASLECVRAGEGAIACTATRHALFGTRRVHDALPDSAMLSVSCVAHTCALWGHEPSGARTSMLSISATDVDEAVRVRDALEAWRASSRATPFVHGGGIDYATASGIVAGSILLLLALVVAPWRTSVRLSGAPRTLAIGRRRWPLRRRDEVHSVGNDRVVFEPAPNGAWGWVVLVRLDGSRQRLFACQSGPTVDVGVAALNGALANGSSSA